jgi:hypothetical protein
MSLQHAPHSDALNQQHRREFLGPPGREIAAAPWHGAMLNKCSFPRHTDFKRMFELYRARFQPHLA